VVLNSFKTAVELQKLVPTFIFTPITDNYKVIVNEYDFFPQLSTTLYVTIFTVAMSSIIGIPAAYALSRARFLFKKYVMFFILLVRFLPYIMFIIPLFMLMTRLQLSGTHFALFLTLTMIPLPIIIWLMKGFFDDIPVDFEEAAFIDGANRFQAFWRIALPSAAPGIAAIVVLTFIFTWNQFLIPLIMAGRETKTIIYGLTRFTGGEAWAERTGPMSAWIVAVVIPVVIISLLVNRYMVKGFTQGID
jgi:multiple sugar transport system permease protein